MRLNIGCGRDYFNGWVNIDSSREVKTDVCMDIRKEQLPAIDGRVSEIYCSGVIEQIGSNEDFVFVMNEMHRVLKNKGKLTIVVPNARYTIAHRDPMDIRKFTPETFRYFKLGVEEYDLYGSVYGFKGWSEITIRESPRHIMSVCLVK
jgi:hypothetical protein